MLHGFDINDDESVLPPELQLEIESIQKTNDALIEKTESYEKTLISESESNETKERINEIMAEIDEKINVANHLIERLDSGGLKEREKFKNAKLELNIKTNLEEIRDKLSLLPFNAKRVDFTNKIKTENNNIQEIGEIIISEMISFEKLFLFNFKDHEGSKSFTHPSRLFEAMDNGTYVVGGFVTKTQKFHLFIYDPIKKKINHELILDEKIDELFTFRNKILFSQRVTGTYCDVDHVFKIMDEHLNLIKERRFSDLLIKGIDETNIYCMYGLNELLLYDWDLNYIKKDCEFQCNDPKLRFYLHRTNQVYYPIILFKRDNKYIVSECCPPNRLSIFDEFGVLLKNFNIFGDFVIDSNNNIIVNCAKRDLIEHYNLNGDLLKIVTYKRPKNFKAIIKKLKIDSFDNIYFGQ